MYVVMPTITWYAFVMLYLHLLIIHVVRSSSYNKQQKPLGPAEYVFIPNLALFGNHFLPITTFWHANFGIDSKLAQTAPLFYRMTDVSFLPKMEH